MKWLKSKDSSIRSRKGAAAAAAALFLCLGLLIIGYSYLKKGTLFENNGMTLIRKGDISQIKKDQTRKKTLYVAVTDMTGMTNPAYATGEADRIASSLIFEGLMKRNQKGAYEPELAERVVMADDGTSCQIVLKKDVHFSDGSLMTARDAAFSIAAMCETAQEEGSTYRDIEGTEEFLNGETKQPSGIVIDNEQTLTVHFTVPSPDHLDIALCRIQKEEQLPAAAAGGIGTGAYVRAENLQSGTIRLEANKSYRERLGDIQAVEFVTYGSQNIQEALKNGMVDVACYGGSSSFYQPFLEAAGYHLYEKPTDTVQYLLVNRSSTALQDENIRKAVSLAIDHQKLEEGALSRYLKASPGLVDEGSDISGKYLPKHDREQAKRLLKKESGDEIQLRLPVLSGNQLQEELAGQVKINLEEAGFSVEVESLDQSEYLQQIYMLGKYDLLISSANGWLTPSTYDQLLADNQGLATGSSNEALQNAVTHLHTAYSQKAQEQALTEVNTVVNQTIPLIPLTRQKKYVAVSADLKHVQLNPYGEFLEKVWKIKVK